jgi:hypothetical protein
MVRIVLMERLNMETFFNMANADMKLLHEAVAESAAADNENI